MIYSCPDLDSVLQVSLVIVTANGDKYVTGARVSASCFKSDYRSAITSMPRPLQLNQGAVEGLAVEGPLPVHK